MTIGTVENSSKFVRTRICIEFLKSKCYILRSFIGHQLFYIDEFTLILLVYWYIHLFVPYQREDVLSPCRFYLYVSRSTTTSAVTSLEDLEGTGENRVVGGSGRYTSGWYSEDIIEQNANKRV